MDHRTHVDEKAEGPRPPRSPRHNHSHGGHRKHGDERRVIKDKSRLPRGVWRIIYGCAAPLSQHQDGRGVALEICLAPDVIDVLDSPENVVSVRGEARTTLDPPNPRKGLCCLEDLDPPWIALGDVTLQPWDPDVTRSSQRTLEATSALWREASLLQAHRRLRQRIWMDTLLFEPVPVRVALLALLLTSGSKPEHAGALRLSHPRIAELCGVNVRSIDRTLATWGREGILVRREKRVPVLNLTALRGELEGTTASPLIDQLLPRVSSAIVTEQSRHR